MRGHLSHSRLDLVETPILTPIAEDRAVSPSLDEARFSQAFRALHNSFRTSDYFSSSRLGSSSMGRLHHHSYEDLSKVPPGRKTSRESFLGFHDLKALRSFMDDFDFDERILQFASPIRGLRHRNKKLSVENLFLGSSESYTGNEDNQKDSIWSISQHVDDAHGTEDPDSLEDIINERNLYPIGKSYRSTFSLGEFSAWQSTENLSMYGRYTKDLAGFAQEEARRHKREEQTSYKEAHKGLPLRRFWWWRRVQFVIVVVWLNTFGRIGEDWLFLALLGVMMAVVSFIMDFGIVLCNSSRIWLYRDLAYHVALQYLGWVSLPVCLILFSAGFVHILAPQAIGSGIPEMKTVLRGINLKEYLTFKTFVAKVIGLTATLGSGLPLGKEGPFVHIASIVATLLSKAVTSFKGIYENESRKSEMLAAACAVGVACSFAAPVGGVLFSIEVTTAYFAVRNYWRGFFAAVCGAMMFRLLAVWFKDEETLSALFKTSFEKDYPFDPQELLVFCTLGAVCGLVGAFFVFVHRRYVKFMRRNKRMKIFLQQSRLLYPFLVMLTYGSLTFPLGMGQFVAGDLLSHRQVTELFSNITWTRSNLTVRELEVVQNWTTPWTGIFFNLFVYIVFTFCGTVIASTLPVPSGIFIPVFKLGAAIGRFAGELMALMFPYGLSYGGKNHIIIPGGYSIAGAAACAGAVTHTISTSVIVFELTGQITHILPVMIAVLISNGIAQFLQPSVYDSIIQIKKLPYLPDILPSTSKAYTVYVEDFMVRDVKFIWYGISYRELKDILLENRKIRSFPLVDSPNSMILLGSVQRTELVSMLEALFGKERRTAALPGWKSNALQKLQLSILDTSSKDRLIIDYELVMSNVTNRKPTDGLSSNSGVAKEEDEETSESAAETVPILASTPREASSNGEAMFLKEESGWQREPTALPSKGHLSLPIEDSAESGTRKLSRFAVTKVETPKAESAVLLEVEPLEQISSSSATVTATGATEESYSSQPKYQLHPKSILKKTQSFNITDSCTTPMASPTATPYATVHGDTSKFRQTLDLVVRKTGLLGRSSSAVFPNAAAPPPDRSDMLVKERLIRLTQEEQEKWQKEELSKDVNFDSCHIDPAPFQLVERTSLFKVHSLFSMLRLSHAYVTAIGRIIGVVALKELRKAIEEANAGEVVKAEAAPTAAAGGNVVSSDVTHAQNGGARLDEKEEKSD